MKNKPNSLLISLSSRPGPRAEWFNRRIGIVSLALFLLSSIVISIVIEIDSHPIEILITVAGFIFYGFFDFLIISQPSEMMSATKTKLIRYWNWTGVISPLIVYFWIIRDLGELGPALLWPLLVFPYYFLLRIIKPISFYPNMLRAIVLYSLLSLLLTFIFSFESRVLYTVAGTIWLLMTLIVISVHLRTWDFHNNRFESYRELVSWAAGSSATLSEFQGKLRSLGERLNLERLAVLELFRPEINADFRDIEKEDLIIPSDTDSQAIRPSLYVKIVAQYIRNKDAKQIRSWPLTRGLLAKSFEKRQAIKCMDTKSMLCKEIYFNFEEVFANINTRCEFIVPVFDSPDGMIIGFVDLQSDEANSLQPEDLDYLTAIASAISPLMVKERLTNLLKGLDNLRPSLEKIIEENKILDLILEFVRTYLDVDVVTYYPLGFGNGWPVTPPYRHGAWFLEDQTNNKNISAPIPLLSEWKLVFEEDARTSRFFSEIQYQNFILKEKIHSTIFIPIGADHRRIGGLFLDFRTTQHFSPTTKLSIEILRQIITPHLERGRQLDDAYRGFGQTAFVLHDLLNESLGTSNLLENRMDTHYQSILQGNSDEILDTFYSLSKTVKTHMKNIASASLKSALDDLKKLHSGLDNAFRSAAGRLEERYFGRSFRWEFYPNDFDRDLPYDLLLAISSIVIEAAHNAVRSGDANLVKVKITRTLKDIQIDILSNGEAWDPSAPPKSYSKYGINARLEIAKKCMDIDYHWSDSGRQLFVVIPILPVDNQEGSYAN